MELLNEKLHSFVIRFCKQNKIRNIDLESINIHTSVEVDLNLDEYEIDKFLEYFSKEFNVDFSDFESEKYLFQNSNFVFLDLIRSIFGYKSSLIKYWANKTYKPKLFLFHLQNAILNRKI